MSDMREALIAEVLGDVGALLERIEDVAPALGSTCDALTHAATSLAARAANAETQFAAFTEHATTKVIKHLAGRSSEIARNAVEVETRAMQAAARALFREQLAPEFHRLARAIETRSARQTTFSRSWRAHAVTAAVASLVTCLVTLLALTGR